MKRIFAILAVAAALVASVSCEKYEDGKPADAIINLFEKMYPDAKDIEWERAGTLWEVSFETGTAPNEIDHTAWYDMEGNWVKTKTEIHVTSVPSEIKEFLQNSEFASSVLEDTEIDFYETPDGNFYRFEVLYNGARVSVDVTEDGKVSLAGLELW